jgi:hypothetical protein
VCSRFPGRTIVPGLVVGMAALLARGPVQARDVGAIQKQPVAFRSGGRALSGYLWAG